MEFLKNHYEKVLLSAVLLALVILVAMLPMKATTAPAPLPEPPRKSVTPVDLTTNRAALKEIAELKPVILYGEHNLVNPVQWRKRPDGVLWKITRPDQVGPGALKMLAATNTPLYFILTLENVLSSGYQIGVVQQASKLLKDRVKISRLVNLNERTPFGTLVRVEGPPENPELVFELADGKGQAVVTKDKPYRRIDGYAANLRYDLDMPGPKLFADRRIGDALPFDGDTNNIVDINSNTVIISSSLLKRTTIKHHATP